MRAPRGDDSPPLIALLGGEAVGTLRQREGRTSLDYEDSWRRSAAAFPLSLSLPLAAAEHRSPAVDAFLWGLLPDNDDILRRWASRFAVSPRNAFALLRMVGEDCAGAVQLVPPERLPALERERPAAVQWVGEEEIGRRLRDLRRDPGASRLPQDVGQFSLAGAQPKVALLRSRGRWGIPSGSMPTTHILKPPIEGFDGHAENEHFCLTLARALGLPAARSEVQVFDGEVAIVVERYDRMEAPPGAATPILRVHQEDLCQALGLHPALKYQREGGPTPLSIVEVLRQHSVAALEDVDSFLAALAFNWLIAGTDAHAKNYSLLIAPGGQVRLAPLYDLASSLPYPSIDQRKAKLAMKIGRTYRLDDVNAHQWRYLAEALRVAPDKLIERVAAMAEAFPAAVQRTAERLRDDGLRHAIVGRLAARLLDHGRACLRRLRV